jgi:hypothetical protein
MPTVPIYTSILRLKTFRLQLLCWNLSGFILWGLVRLFQNVEQTWINELRKAFSQGIFFADVYLCF